jgi:ElaB/YqjD/DUF883 family membrane-anchored ribosome-binding protein
MKEVNAAYAAGDVDGLRRVLANLENSPDAVQGAGVGADLVRVLRQMRQLRDRLTEIAKEMAGLAGTEIANLKAKADAAGAEGRDLLAEMAAIVQGRVNVARQQFGRESDERYGK